MFCANIAVPYDGRPKLPAQLVEAWGYPEYVRIGFSSVNRIIRIWPMNMFETAKWPSHPLGGVPERRTVQLAEGFVETGVDEIGRIAIPKGFRTGAKLGKTGHLCWSNREAVLTSGPLKKSQTSYNRELVLRFRDDHLLLASQQYKKGILAIGRYRKIGILMEDYQMDDVASILQNSSVHMWFHTRTVSPPPMTIVVSNDYDKYGLLLWPRLAWEALSSELHEIGVASTDPEALVYDLFGNRFIAKFDGSGRVHLPEMEKRWGKLPMKLIETPALDIIEMVLFDFTGSVQNHTICLVNLLIVVPSGSTPEQDGDPHFVKIYPPLFHDIVVKRINKVVSSLKTKLMTLPSVSAYPYYLDAGKQTMEIVPGFVKTSLRANKSLDLGRIKLSGQYSDFEPTKRWPTAENLQ